jgi:hypothetical protein
VIPVTRQRYEDPCHVGSFDVTALAFGLTKDENSPDLRRASGVDVTRELIAANRPLLSSSYNPPPIDRRDFSRFDPFHETSKMMNASRRGPAALSQEEGRGRSTGSRRHDPHRTSHQRIHRWQPLSLGLVIVVALPLHLLHLPGAAQAFTLPDNAFSSATAASKTRVTNRGATNMRPMSPVAGTPAPLHLLRRFPIQRSPTALRYRPLDEQDDEGDPSYVRVRSKAPSFGLYDVKEAIRSKQDDDNSKKELRRSSPPPGVQPPPPSSSSPGQPTRGRAMNVALIRALELNQVRQYGVDREFGSDSLSSACTKLKIPSHVPPISSSRTVPDLGPRGDPVLREARRRRWLRGPRARGRGLELGRRIGSGGIQLLRAGPVGRGGRPPASGHQQPNRELRSGTFRSHAVFLFVFDRRCVVHAFSPSLHRLLSSQPIV